MRRVWYLALAVVACGGREESLMLTRDEWRRVTVPTYHVLYDDYVKEMPANLAVPATLRDHFAGDPRLTFDQAVTRWALPTLAPAKVGDGVDAVFVDVDGKRRAIVGLGAIVVRRIAEWDRACAEAVRWAEAEGTCIEAAWFVTDTMLRGSHERFAHACSLAINACR